MKAKKSALEKSWGQLAPIAKSIRSLKEDVDDYKYVGAGIYLTNPEFFRECAAFLASQAMAITIDLMRIAGQGAGGEDRLRRAQAFAMRRSNGKRLS
jgi:hypothetical protein